MLSLSFARPALVIAASLLGLGTLDGVSENHQFDLTWDQHQSFTFAVDAPGRIDARIAWQGAPLAVSLIGPDGRVAQQTGNGHAEVSYTVTAADVAKGRAWQVALQSTAHDGAPAVIIAKGTVAIEHPPGDMEKLKASALAAQQQWMATFRSQGAQLQAKLASAQRAQLAQLAQLAQAAAEAAQQRQNELRAHVVALRAKPVAAQRVNVAAAVRPLPGVHAAPVVHAPPPSVSSLSSTEAQPGDAILITGSGFGNSPAELGTTVYMIVAPGKVVQFGTPDYQSDTQIQTSIPASISGVADNPHAALYVRNANGPSALVPFHFKPAIATASVTVNPNDVTTVDESDCDSNDDKLAPDALNAGGVYHRGGWLCGGSGNDPWNAGRHLKNGWTVISVDPGKRVFPDADATVSQSHPGTSDLSFVVHWWTTAGNYSGAVLYLPVIYIQGPAGIPWQ